MCHHWIRDTYRAAEKEAGRAFDAEDEPPEESEPGEDATADERSVEVPTADD